MAISKGGGSGLGYNPKSTGNMYGYTGGQHLYPSAGRKKPRSGGGGGAGGGGYTPPPSPDDFLNDMNSSAEEEADRIVDEMLAELGYARDASRRQAEQTAQGEIARAQALSQALQAMNMPGLIQGVYQNSGQSLAGLAQGFSSSTAALANQHGAEQANMVAGTGQEGAVRNEGAAMSDVQYGLYGFIPGRTLEETGAAFAANAAMQPGFALQFGQLAASKAMEDWIANELPQFTDDEAKIRTKRSSLIADAKEREAAEKDKKKDEAYDLYEAGLITQRDLGRRLGVPGWKTMPNTRKGEEGKSGIELRTIGGDLVAVNMNTGKVQVLYQGPQDDNWHYFQASDGSDWRINERTGKKQQIGGAESAKPPIIRGSPSTGFQAFDAYTGQPLWTTEPTYTSPTTKKGAGPLWKQNGFKSAADMNATAAQYAKYVLGTKDETDKYGKVTKKGRPKMGPIDAYNYLVSKNIPPAIARKYLSKYYDPSKLPKVEPASGGAKNISYSALKRVGGYDKHQSQMINLALSMTANDNPIVRKALLAAMAVESNFRNLNYGDRDSQGVLQQRPSTGWGPPGNAKRDIAQFLQKARKYAASWGGTAGQLAQKIQVSAFPDRYDEQMGRIEKILGLGSKVQSSSSSQNVSFKPGGGWGGSHDIAESLSEVTQQHGLKIWSEKRNKKATASGGVSDHWVGSKDSYAYDMSGSVPQMDRAALDLLASLGYQWDGKSSVVKNFYKNGYRIQVLYRTNIGGNHYNHIHIGVRKEGESA